MFLAVLKLWKLSALLPTYSQFSKTLRNNCRSVKKRQTKKISSKNNKFKPKKEWSGKTWLTWGNCRFLRSIYRHLSSCTWSAFPPVAYSRPEEKNRKLFRLKSGNKENLTIKTFGRLFSILSEIWVKPTNLDGVQVY